MWIRKLICDPIYKYSLMLGCASYNLMSWLPEQICVYIFFLFDYHMGEYISIFLFIQFWTDDSFIAILDTENSNQQGYAFVFNKKIKFLKLLIIVKICAAHKKN